MSLSFAWQFDPYAPLTKRHKVDTFYAIDCEVDKTYILEKLCCLDSGVILMFRQLLLLNNTIKTIETLFNTIILKATKIHSFCVHQ